MKRQLVTYFGLAYFISWIIWLPLYGHIFGLSNLPTLPFHHSIGGLGPLMAAFITMWLYHRKEGVRRLLRKCFKLKPFVYMAIALFGPFLLVLVAAIINFFINKASINLDGIFTSKEFPSFNLLSLFAYNLLFFGFGEEAGWRGFALPRLQGKFNALTSSIILTFFWAIWHWPLFLYRPGYMSMDFAEIFGWFFSLLTGSILLTWLFNSSKGSVLICAVFHATVDIAFTADLADKQIVNYMGFLITIWGILTIIIFKPKNLAMNPRERYGDLQNSSKRLKD